MMLGGQGQRLIISHPFPITCYTVKSSHSLHHFSLKVPGRPKLVHLPLASSRSDQTHQYKPQTKTQDDGIPIDDVKVIAKFKTRHNYIRVLQVSRSADHPFAGSRLLLLDSPGNIHSISFLFKSLTNTYFDVFATLPPILPPGPVGILGFGAGSAARLMLELYPELRIHGWELDPSVVEVGREYFGLEKLEKQYPDRLYIYIGNALKASIRNGFAGILVDLFCKGSLIPELQDPTTWQKLRKSLRKGGRIMVNVGGSCVEAEDERRNGKMVMEETLKAMHRVFGDKLFVLNLGNGKDDDSSLALTGELAVSDLDAWKKKLPRSLKGYVDMWAAYQDS
ncbi:ras-related protein RABA4c-like [Hibiscus syriacus]|uniref:Ras-related protein RABA4c-like n=1 Tax=Hibiscus syriacus TaxID=106335 RepID=A0A6A3AZF3_HIBSY|nr:probable polyamine aminopropyl transferase [Hibiscus syriacus]KAE8708179.1 ras-related protein RABA4c-like [Hibiscus syriacus]